jgi:hypothetical protein
MLDGDEVPEAWSYDQKTLPHLQTKLEQLFPKAVAAPPAGDQDPPERTLMGESWADMPLDMAEAIENDSSRLKPGESWSSEFVVEINMMDWGDSHGVGGALVVPPDELPSETPNAWAMGETTTDNDYFLDSEAYMLDQYVNNLGTEDMNMLGHEAFIVGPDTFMLDPEAFILGPEENIEGYEVTETTKMGETNDLGVANDNATAKDFVGLFMNEPGEVKDLNFDFMLGSEQNLSNFGNATKGASQRPDGYSSLLHVAGPRCLPGSMLTGQRSLNAISPCLGVSGQCPCGSSRSNCDVSSIVSKSVEANNSDSDMASILSSIDVRRKAKRKVDDHHVYHELPFCNTNIYVPVVRTGIYLYLYTDTAFLRQLKVPQVVLPSGQSEGESETAELSELSLRALRAVSLEAFSLSHSLEPLGCLATTLPVWGPALLGMTHDLERLACWDALNDMIAAPLLRVHSMSIHHSIVACSLHEHFTYSVYNGQPNVLYNQYNTLRHTSTPLSVHTGDGPCAAAAGRETDLICVLV